MHRRLHYYVVAIAWFIFPDHRAVGQSTLSGIITDKQTGEPVPFANVYFAHTTLGTSSAGDGTFEIRKIPNGKYDLQIEMVGYQKHKQPLEFQDAPYKIKVELAQENFRLDSVTVLADQSDRKYYPTFFNFFVGHGENAKRCEILNPEDLHFYFDKNNNNLTVSSRKAVRVSNPELGYIVHYMIDRFELDFATAAKIMEGSPRFEEIPSRSRRDSISRQKKRNQAYSGSLYHFMRSLYQNELDKEKFKLFEVDSIEVAGSFIKEGVLRPFNTEKILSGDRIRSLRFTGTLKMEYEKSEDWEYPGRRSTLYESNPHGYQQTYLQLRNPAITIYENGYFSDQLSVFMTGYLVWKETVCNMVPLGHEIGTKEKEKGDEKK